ncbi:MAG: hypothetical protein ACREBG_16185 [Pyrinomonadaceae bacterium]
MRAEEWFAMAVRVIGVVVFLHGVGYLFDSALFRLGYFNYPETSPSYYVIAGISYGIVGLYLMRGAPHIVRFAYSLEEGEDEDEEKKEKGDDEVADQHDV